jgi:Holliday junction DNA helicase RuvB
VPEEQVARTTIAPLDFESRSANELRPQTFADMVGQQRLKRLLGRIVGASRASGRPLDHILLVGASGTGKTTLGQVIAHESGRRVFQVGAPVTTDVFEQLRQVAQDGDVVIVDEIHMQVSGDRRGITQAADPEAFFSVMEDRRLVTSTGVVDFPAITIIGCTTDAGLLPEPFLGRFPLQPQLDPYTTDDMAVLARHNAAALGLGLTAVAARIFAGASRANPRQLNRYLRNASSLAEGLIGGEIAREVVVDLNSTTLDGLTMPMQRMLRFLLSAERVVGGETKYRASVNTIATALGFSRDTKNVALFVEPWLLQQGLVQVSPQGRELTPTGVARARRL